MSGIRISTWLAAAACLGAVALTHADPWEDERAAAIRTSSRSDARRVLPELSDVDVATASIELRAPSGATVRIEPDGAGGHTLFEDEEVLGPADREAVEGLWSSLRIATTLRAVAEGSDVGLGEGGSIALAWPGQSRRIALGRAAVGAPGRFGVVEGGAAGTEGTWVLEEELHTLVMQAPRAWLSRRAVAIEPSMVASVAFADGTTVRRGEDAQWRSQGALLQPDAVDRRLQRMLSARLDPLVPAPVGATTDFVTVEPVVGEPVVLRTGPRCPGRPERVVLVRGPGLAGCIDAALTEAWPLPGRAEPGAPSLLHPDLLPYDYGAVLRIEQRRPRATTLARRGGGWRLEEVLEGREVGSDVDEAEVFRWYTALSGAQVQAFEGEPPMREGAGEGARDGAGEGAPESDVALHVVTETTVTMNLACWRTRTVPTHEGAAAAESWVCRRDAGPWLAVQTPGLSPKFDAETFAERRLLRLSVDDVRAIEILPGPGRAAPRQSAHFDLGVWRLDAPAHPDGDDAMDETRLVATLNTVAGLRAAAWLDAAPQGSPHRTVRVSTIPRRGEPSEIAIDLHVLEASGGEDGSGVDEGAGRSPGERATCVAVLAGQRPARLSDSACSRLRGSLLRDDPLQAWLLDAGGLSLSLPTDAPAVRLEPADLQWVPAEPVQDEAAIRRLLEAMGAFRAESLSEGEPPGPASARLRVTPRRGVPYDVDLRLDAAGTGWVRIAGQAWHYRGRTTLADAPPLDGEGLDGEGLEDPAAP